MRDVFTSDVVIDMSAEGGDMLWRPEDGPIRHMHGHGHFHETYRRTPDGRRIASMTFTRLHRRLDP